MTDVNQTLDQRGKHYGSFASTAAAAQGLKGVIFSQLEVHDRAIEHDQLEALDMICTKLARIVTGDPHYIDNWIDIAGYATLVAQRLEGKSA